MRHWWEPEENWLEWDEDERENNEIIDYSRPEEGEEESIIKNKLRRF